jgi:hypothetical protein
VEEWSKRTVDLAKKDHYTYLQLIYERFGYFKTVCKRLNPNLLIAIETEAGPNDPITLEVMICTSIREAIALKTDSFFRLYSKLALTNAPSVTVLLSDVMDIVGHHITGPYQVQNTYRLSNDLRSDPLLVRVCQIALDSQSKPGSRLLANFSALMPELITMVESIICTGNTLEKELPNCGMVQATAWLYDKFITEYKDWAERSIISRDLAGFKSKLESLQVFTKKYNVLDDIIMSSVNQEISLRSLKADQDSAARGFVLLVQFFYQLFPV